MNQNYRSLFAPYIKGLIVQKNALGYPYESSSRCLYNFDCFCKDNYPDEAVLTKIVVEEWATKRFGEHSNGLTRRITPIRQLAKYMLSIGSNAYILPDGLPGKQIKYIPYVFTKKEMTNFFQASDHLGYCPGSKTRHIIVPVMFRVMYTCGLRAGETRFLLKKDFNPLKGTIFIRESKGHKDREIYLSEDVCKLVQTYDSIVAKLFPERAYLFVSPRGIQISNSAFNNYFHLILKKANINSDIKQIRPYDLRHAYAVHRINQWISEGEDFNKLIPYLSKHMGHSNFNETSYYIHLTPEFYPEMEKRLNSTHHTVIPGDDYADE